MSARRQHRRQRGSTLTLRHGDDLKKHSARIPTTRCPYGKRRYYNRHDAEIVLSCMDRSDPQRREQRSYLCPACGGWHLTSQSRAEYTAATHPANRADAIVEPTVSGAVATVSVAPTPRRYDIPVRRSPMPTPGEVAARHRARKSRVAEESTVPRNPAIGAVGILQRAWVRLRHWIIRPR
ncbi:hypothetical protein [Nocardia aurea]|uniref:hypothetical protein n=1 Tax=Nocardia aurea TaxID=2144174 RepID=UPI0033AE8567